MKLLVVPALAVAALAAPKPKVVEPPAPVQLAEGDGVKKVRVNDQDVVRVNAKVGFSTLILLPHEERIVHANTGDSQLWIVTAKENMAFVKPAKDGSSTNVDLLTTSGNVYSFVFTEGAGPADIKVFVEARSDSMLGAMVGKPKFVDYRQVEDFAEQVKIAKAETATARKESAEQIAAAVRSADVRLDQARSEIPATMKFPYQYVDTEDFQVRAMYTDGTFMYIQANPRETPTVFAIDPDGKSNLVQFDFKDGTYTIRRVLDRGYLQIGKRRLHFSRKDQK